MDLLSWIRRLDADCPQSVLQLSLCRDIEAHFVPNAAHCVEDVIGCACHGYRYRIGMDFDAEAATIGASFDSDAGAVATVADTRPHAPPGPWYLHVWRMEDAWIMAASVKHKRSKIVAGPVGPL